MPVGAAATAMVCRLIIFRMTPPLELQAAIGTGLSPSRPSRESPLGVRGLRPATASSACFSTASGAPPSGPFSGWPSAWKCRRPKSCGSCRRTSPGWAHRPPRRPHRDRLAVHRWKGRGRPRGAPGGVGGREAAVDPTSVPRGTATRALPACSPSRGPHGWCVAALAMRIPRLWWRSRAMPPAPGFGGWLPVDSGAPSGGSCNYAEKPAPFIAGIAAPISSNAQRACDEAWAMPMNPWIVPLYRVHVTGTPASSSRRAYASPSSRSTAHSAVIANAGATPAQVFRQQRRSVRMGVVLRLQHMEVPAPLHLNSRQEVPLRELLVGRGVHRSKIEGSVHQHLQRERGTTFVPAP